MTQGEKGCRGEVWKVELKIKAAEEAARARLHCCSETQDQRGLGAVRYCFLGLEGRVSNRMYRDGRHEWEVVSWGASRFL